ncbi:hypothetical protein HGM15179_005634 [Zosterops borbonicus]|uniref:Uncharacterized protein n=1 Tax=Zosterops borbonicus TaxID=364589 RepID=A0A8K1GP04_9PASS|nr:hypothetical protein HGM15179_005634 [Zosterops borbonicus]
MPASFKMDLTLDKTISNGAKAFTWDVTRDDLTLKGIVRFPQSQKYPRVKYIIRIAAYRGFTAQERLGSTIFGGARNFRAENTIQTRTEPHLLATDIE